MGKLSEFAAIRDLFRYITFSFAAIFALLVFATFSHATVIYENEAHNITFLNQQSNNVAAGYIMKFSKVVTTINFTTDSLDTSTRCILYNADANPMSIITTASISNHNCNLVYTLNITSFFALGADANGGTFNQRYTNTVSFPINLGSGNITDGFLITSGTTYASQTLLFSLTGIWITYNATIPISITSFSVSSTTNQSVNLLYSFTGDFQNLTIFRNGTLIHSVTIADSSFLDSSLSPSTLYGYSLVVCSSINCASANITATTLANTPVITITTADALIKVGSILNLWWVILIAFFFLAVAVLLKSPIIISFEVVPFGLIALNRAQEYLSTGGLFDVASVLLFSVVAFGMVFIGGYLQFMQVMKNNLETKRKKNGMYDQETFYGKYS